MNGFRAMLMKEVRETLRTWRIAVLPGFMLLNAVASPILAAMAPRLLTATMGAGVPALPDPTAWDAYAQWVKNLTPLTVLIVIVTASGSVCGEIAGGVAPIVLTKPISRVAFVMAKFAAATLLILGTTTVATLLTWGVTLAMFPSIPCGPLVGASALWSTLAVLSLALSLLFSSVLRSAAGAAGLGCAVLIVLSTLSMWDTAARYSPAGVVAVLPKLAQGNSVDWAWPAATSLASTGLCLWVAILALSRREI
ncbi:hypothetical protein KEM60_00139 [Austwickia sp. TVS 96-490-7B]|uniref:ABC transporter permease subunit n=1 Tax=Austwickia sp. TVS 96-490-7B TaxID=2830843 RepID=UPI001C59B18C|nr:ABC transporter permease subunit [Austwickia sp. TVS 96-490-7B]MBW3083956.1 hypothetical protein [Austwickia sp. TVS 96-490-7B]